MLEPETNPTPGWLVDPPAWIRLIMSRLVLAPQADESKLHARRNKTEARRRERGEPHIVDYFHQLDDPYSHLAVQVLQQLVERYDIKLNLNLIRATGGKSQPEFEKLAIWARRDAELIAPHFGLTFPSSAGRTPNDDLISLAGTAIRAAFNRDRLDEVADLSRALWTGSEIDISSHRDNATDRKELEQALDEGSALLRHRNHYSGAMFYYGGEWYWGIDRLSHLERRLRGLRACKNVDTPLIAPRPEIDLTGMDASHLRLDFYPSLNSPYTAIVFDQTIAMKDSCNIEFHHKPVLPMVMRGVPAPPAKAKYIVFDTKREADAAAVPFGDLIMPIGMPTRRAYSLLPWAKSRGKDERLMSELLRHAFALGVGLHTQRGMRRAVEAAGLDWEQAQSVIDSDDWKPMVEQNQMEMVDGLGLWGVPSFRLSGPDDEPDLAVWGQDRLWLIAADIKRRVEKTR